MENSKYSLEELVNRNGVINEKKLLNKIEPATAKSGSKSVLKPSAQSNTLCGSQGQVEEEERINIVELLHSAGYYNPISMIIELMYNGGLRVSEVLRIKGTDIVGNDRVRIKASKGSDDRLVQLFHTRDRLIGFKGSPYNVFEGLSRWYVYREFKKLGIGKRFGENRNNSVTHYFRQQQARSLENDGLEDSIRSKFLGHKNGKSIKHYSNGKK